MAGKDAEELLSEAKSLLLYSFRYLDLFYSYLIQFHFAVISNQCQTLIIASTSYVLPFVSKPFRCYSISWLWWREIELSAAISQWSSWAAPASGNHQCNKWNATITATRNIPKSLFLGSLWLMQIVPDTSRESSVFHHSLRWTCACFSLVPCFLSGPR